MTSEQEALYHLVQRYVERQKIVRDAIADLRPAWLILDTLSRDELLDAVLYHPDRPQSGDWRDWKYFMHGLGCRLTHQVTGEVVDWDPPDVQEFDAWKFAHWLKSIIAIETNDEYRRRLTWIEDAGRRNELYEEVKKHQEELPGVVETTRMHQALYRLLEGG